MRGPREGYRPHHGAVFVPLPGPQTLGRGLCSCSLSPLAPRILRDSADQADALLSGPPAGHEPWAVHQAYCRLPLHLLGFHGEWGSDMLSLMGECNRGWDRP